ncbi:hypothetical protein AAMO2058_001019900 [Amorphochlora amoebiformis]|mmetsp:Transcript_5903/g.9057  ORF Transcript_5903/g.9057 Transcript_5903/m.9057 type:complete len:128 (-) Transcript_5903:281-664(-)
MPKFFFGEVIKKSSAKTVKVRIDQMVYSRTLRQKIKRSTNLLTHDPEEKCDVGDFIKVRHSGYKNISKRKAHVLEHIIRKYDGSRGRQFEAMWQAARSMPITESEEGVVEAVEVSPPEEAVVTEQKQ